MIREPRFVTETCSHCHRPGYRHKIPFSLLTEAEQIDVFGTDSQKRHKKGIKGAPESAEICWAGAGSHINECIKEAIQIAKDMSKPVAFEFNGHTVIVYRDSDPDKVMRDWWQFVYKETPEESWKAR